MIKYIPILLILLIFASCKEKKTEAKKLENIIVKEAEPIKTIESRKIKTWTDSHGNVFTEIGNQVYIKPARYNRTGKIYKIFIYNETSQEIGIIEKLRIKPNDFRVFNLEDIDTLKLENGVKFMFGETYGLEVEDEKSQVSGIGGKYLKLYKVPEDAEWAFTILPVMEGDSVPQSKE